METIDLQLEARALEARQGDVTSKMLLKTGDLRLLLMSLKKGAQLHEHHADARISIHVLSGTVKLLAEGKTLELSAGHVTTLEASVPHSVEARESSALLVTMAWPKAAELKKMPHRGYS
jgi:quercetin dioxygenase-like cupin family protein